MMNIALFIFFVILGLLNAFWSIHYLFALSEKINNKMSKADIISIRKKQTKMAIIVVLNMIFLLILTLRILFFLAIFIIAGLTGNDPGMSI